MGASGLLIIIVLFALYKKGKMKTAELIEDDFSSMEHVVEAVKKEMVEIIKDDFSLGLSDAEFNALYKRKARIQDALKNSVHGIDSAKVIVIELIRGFIAQNISPQRISELIGVSDGMQPSSHVMFEILMYRFKKEYNKQALAKMIEKYDLDRLREASFAESENDKAYFVTLADLTYVYEMEDITLSKDECTDILAILVYQQYKGFGILDTLREMDINGFNCGTSGSINQGVKTHQTVGLKATNSVWLYHRGKYIHLRFMSFGSEDELKRIIQLLVRYNNPGPLTAKRGYLVNTMYDKSRILALRPPASEYWAVFVRKFTLSDPSPRALIVKPHTVRGDLPLRLIEFIMRGQITAGVTGRQGSGKTTLMAAIIRYIDPRYTLRLLEMAPELYLRELYPTRNILSVQETDTVTSTELQDALKKSDAAVSIVGEVATDPIAARMIQMGMTASLFTLFSHHANTARDLVLTLRNSLVNAGGFTNSMIAERQITDVVKLDIHLDYSPDGDRFIERITEIIPIAEKIAYPEYDLSDAHHSMNRITAEYFARQTDRETFTTRDILVYDKKTKTYRAVNRFSPELEESIRSNLGDLALEFDKFIYSEWGRRPSSESVEVDKVEKSVLEYYREVELEEEKLSSLDLTIDLVDIDSISDAIASHPTLAPQIEIYTSESAPVVEVTEEVKEQVETVIQAVIRKENEIQEQEIAISEIESNNPTPEEEEELEDAVTMFDFFDGRINI